MPRDSGESRGATSANAQAVAGVLPEKEFLLGEDVSLVVQVPGLASIEGVAVHGDASTEVDSIVVDQQVDAEPEEPEAFHANTCLSSQRG